MPTYEVTYTVVVDSGDATDAEDEARQLIANPRFEPTSVEVVGPEVTEADWYHVIIDALDLMRETVKSTDDDNGAWAAYDADPETDAKATQEGYLRVIDHAQDYATMMLEAVEKAAA